MDKEFMAFLREQQRIRAENRRDMKWLDGCLKKLSHEAVKRSLDLLKRTERKPLTRIGTPPDGAVTGLPKAPNGYPSPAETLGRRRPRDSGI